MKLLPFTLFVFGLVATGFVWTYARASYIDKETLAYEHRKDQAMASIERRLEEHVSLLRATAAAISISPDLTGVQFHDYVHTLQIERNYPGILGVGYAFSVERE
ncbi:MAG TPA: hypothetical protein VGE01_03815, partial [Fimbriimonas sp.]